MKRFLKRFDLLGKTLYFPPFIELRGRESLLFDGECRITDYSDSRIELMSDNGLVEVKGEGLTLRHLSPGRLAIDGRIDGIGFLQTDKVHIR